MTTTATNETTQAVAQPPPSRIHYVTPAVAIFEDVDGYTIEAEMPGVGKDGVHITVENGELCITGDRKSRPSTACIYGEVVHADYRRTIDLDPAVDADKITASMDQGLLVLRLPKAHDKKPRRIQVTG